MLEPPSCATTDRLLPAQALAGRRRAVTAGPTFEAIDPVRGITNLSSGKMGFAIARAARGRRRGHAGGRPGAPAHAARRARIDVQSAQQMLRRGAAAGAAHDVFVATAAVADWRPAGRGEHKIKKDGSGRRPPSSWSRTPTSWPPWRAARRRPTAWASPPRATTWSATRARSSAQERAADRRQPRPGHLRPDDNALLLVDAARRARAAAADKLTLARATGGRDRPAPAGPDAMTTIDVKVLDARMAEPCRPMPRPAAPAWTCAPAWTAAGAGSPARPR
jgi:phosphopantothenoylcysteine decarboxylase/phosphopantothenate--cysteine ligase